MSYSYPFYLASLPLLDAQGDQDLGVTVTAPLLAVSGHLLMMVKCHIPMSFNMLII